MEKTLQSNCNYYSKSVKYSYTRNYLYNILLWQLLNISGWRVPMWMKWEAITFCARTELFRSLLVIPAALPLPDTRDHGTQVFAEWKEFDRAQKFLSLFVMGPWHRMKTWRKDSWTDGRLIFEDWFFEFWSCAFFPWKNSHSQNLTSLSNYEYKTYEYKQFLLLFPERWHSCITIMRVKS